MKQKTNLNTSPYYDDFDQSKNFYKVLFKPGFPVQARELTSSQSISQDQLSKFSNYVFKNGAKVIPGDPSFQDNVRSIKLNTTNPKPNEAFILVKKRKKSYKNYYYLSKTKNLKQAAKNLYKTLRVIKNKNYKSIVVEKIPNVGFGEVINDRLKKASAK